MGRKQIMNDPIPKIDLSWRPTYYDALQLVKCFDIDPGTPNAAALLSLLYEEHNLSSCRGNLKKWLYEYILPFALNPIRNEQNLVEKTLAIAVFIFLSKEDSDNIKLPDEQLINYIEYAEKQFWLNDPFLAFYCHFLKDQLVSCENVADYFKTNYELFLQKKNVSAISQSLIVLKNDLSNTDKQRGFNVIVDLLERKEITNKNLAWALWALSPQSGLYTPVIEKLASMLDEEISRLLNDIQRESGLAIVFAMMLTGVSDLHIENYIKELKKNSASKIKISQNNTRYEFSVEPNIRDKNSNLSLNDLGLTLIAMHTAQYDKAAYIRGVQKERITDLEHSLKYLSQGSIILSKFERSAVNFLVIFFTIFVGLLALFIQTGFPAKFTDIKLDWESVVILVVWLDYLLAQVQAVWSGKSALDGIKKIPLIRHGFSMFMKTKK